MKQKLSISCALIHQPELLLLDEPTFGVDPISRRDLWLILHEMVAEGVTIIVSTSYLDEAERCDRIALLNHGRMLALDSPVRLQASIAGDLVALRAAEPRRARDLLQRDSAVRSATLFGESIHLLMNPGQDPGASTRRLKSAGLDVLEVGPISPSLEDVFIHLVDGGARDV